MAKVIYDSEGRAIGIQKEFWDGFLGDRVDETADSFIVKKHGLFGIGGGETRILKSRTSTIRHISIQHSLVDAKVSIGGKVIKVDDLPPEVRKKLGL